MKSVNRCFALFLAVALIVLAPLAGSITASAADPKTFQAKYIPELGEWRTQCLPSWDDSRENGNLDFLLNNVADGDAVVIHAAAGSNLEITFTKTLGNLTVVGANSSEGCIIVHSEKAIKDFYAIQGAVVSLNSEVENAYIYDNVACNLNKNAKNVYITGESKMEMNVAALGTVGKCVIKDTKGNTTTMYNIKENALRVEKGENKTASQNYSTDPASAPSTPSTTTTPAAPSASTTTPTATAAPSTSTATTPSATHSPATGGSSDALLLLAGVLFCLAISFTLRRKRA